jgi:hypothetical protein
MFSTDYKSVEEVVSDQQGSYRGLSSEALLTSAEDFKTIFNALPEIKVWIEPGSGHGLGPLLFASLYPQKKSIGIEFELPRFEASEALKKQSAMNNVTFQHLNLLDHDLPLGDTYFFYFPTGMVLDRMLHSLKQRTDRFRLIAIESHGDLLPRLNKEIWLREVKQIPLKQQRHHPFAVVYENGGEASSSLHDYSFLKKFLLIEDENSQQWLGESFNLEWQGQDQYLLNCPPRSIRSEQVKNVWDLEQVESRFHHALGLRKLGELSFETAQGNFVGSLRKIFVSPTFKVEISSGQQVEWSQITKIYWESTLCFDSSSDYSFLPHVV